ncbi:MAG: hypothetical protein ACR2OH_13025 [Microthrixaceae bacterium]
MKGNMLVENQTADSFNLTLDRTELRAVQSGLRETLEALDDWEFEIRTGVTQQLMRQMLDEILEIP